MKLKEVPEGLYAKLPLDEVSVGDAINAVDDPSWFYSTLAPVLHFFPQFSLLDFYGLSVKEHRLLVEFLLASGKPGLVAD